MGGLGNMVSGVLGGVLGGGGGGGGGGGSSQPMGYPPGYGQVQSGLGGLFGGGGGGGLLGGLLGGLPGGSMASGMLGGLPLLGGLFGGGGGSPFGGLGGMLGGKGIPTPFGQFNPMNPFGGGFNPMNPFGQQQGAPDWYNKPPSWWNQGPQGAPKPAATMLKSPSSMGLQRPPQAQAGGGGNPHVGTVMGDDAGAMYYGGSGASPQTTAASATAPLRSASATATLPQRAAPVGSSFVPRASTYSPPQLLPQRSTTTATMLRAPSSYTAPTATSTFGGALGGLPRLLPGRK